MISQDRIQGQSSNLCCSSFFLGFCALKELPNCVAERCAAGPHGAESEANLVLRESSSTGSQQQLIHAPGSFLLCWGSGQAELCHVQVWHGYEPSALVCSSCESTRLSANTTWGLCWLQADVADPGWQMTDEVAVVRGREGRSGEAAGLGFHLEMWHTQIVRPSSPCWVEPDFPSLCAMNKQAVLRSLAEHR